MGYRRPADQQAEGSRVRAIKRTLWVILILNFGVAIAKLAVGTIANSTAMQADGFHSLFDGTSNIVGLVGMGFAGRPADEDHPYGHSKYETYASAIIGAMLLFAAYRIGSEAIAGLLGHTAPPTIDAIAFAVMIGTLVINIGVTTWERSVGRKLGSAILIADASHTASDVLVSVGVLVSLVLVKFFHMEKADPIVALLITGVIVYTALDLFKQASATLSDAVRIPPGDICTVALGVPGVLGCHSIRTRGSEAEVNVDLHIQVDPKVTVAEGHEIAERVEREIASHYPQVVDVIAHLEPDDSYQQAKTAHESGA